MIVRIFLYFFGYQYFAYMLLIFIQIMNAITTILVYKTTNMVFDDHKIAYLSAIFFIVNPANIFMTVIYTEPFFSFLQYLTIFFYLKVILMIQGSNSNGISDLKYMILAILVNTVDCYARSNAVLTIIVIGYRIIQDFILPEKSFN